MKTNDNDKKNGAGEEKSNGGSAAEAAAGAAANENKKKEHADMFNGQPEKPNAKPKTKPSDNDDKKNA